MVAARRLQHQLHRQAARKEPGLVGKTVIVTLVVIATLAGLWFLFSMLGAGARALMATPVAERAPLQPATPPERRFTPAEIQAMRRAAFDNAGAEIEREHQAEFAAAINRYKSGIESVRGMPTDKQMAFYWEQERIFTPMRDKASGALKAECQSMIDQIERALLDVQQRARSSP